MLGDVPATLGSWFTVDVVAVGGVVVGEVKGAVESFFVDRFVD